MIKHVSSRHGAIVIVGIAVSVAAIVALIVSGASCMTTFSTYSSMISELDSDIAVQQKKLETVSDATVLTVDDAEQNSADATALGQQVAELQSKYIGEFDESTIAANASELSKAFSADDQNARTPWFSCWVTDAAGEQAVWTFKSVVGYSDSNVAAFDVIWLCTYRATGEVLAYTTATYDSDENVFSNVSTHTTTFGADAINKQSKAEQGDAATTSSETYNSDIDSIVESLKSGSSDETGDSGPVYSVDE